MERELRVVVTEPSDAREIGADGLAEQCQRLVFLGGPGSGKTWLAKRLARRCAQQALEALRTGKSPEGVELPLYTTCSEFFKAGGSVREAAVSSALKFADLGSARVSTALKALFVERDGPTLLIIDSLDEASGSDQPLLDADALPWRIVLTSRPSSWDRQLIPQSGNDSKKVARLQPLRYPEDVESIVAYWFAGQPERSRDIAAQIARRPALQQAATVPLILAFFCIIGYTGEPLPEFRHALNTKVLRRMLSGSWRGTQVDSHSQPNVDLCLRALQAWAWSAAAKHPVSGIGTWVDEVPADSLDVCWPGWPARGPSDADRNALDNVATPLGPADFDTDPTQRRFVHRSLREHLVAQHVASLSVDEAVEALLPHLWYDPDWEYSAPAALVMHREHDEVLRKLLCRVVRSDTISAKSSLKGGGRELRAFIARVAGESAKDDWSPDMARLISNTANQLAQPSSSAVGIGDAVAWGIPKQQARMTLQKLLADFRPESDDDFGGLIGIASRHFCKQVNQMVWLAETVEERRETRQVLLKLLDDQTQGRAAAWLAAGVMKLEPTDEERRAARVRLLDLLASQHDDSATDTLMDRIIQLEPTVEERRAARVRLLDLLASQHDDSATDTLMDRIIQLEPTDEERHAARVRLLDLLANSLPHEGGKDDLFRRSSLDLFPASNWESILGWVIRLAVTAQDKKESREALLSMAVTQKIGLVAAELVSGLGRLDPAEEDCQKARALLLNLLAAQPDGLIVHNLVSGLVQLAVTPQGKREVSKALQELLINRYITSTDLYAVRQVVSGMAQLAITTDQKCEARKALRELLNSQVGRNIAAEVIAGIIQLDPTDQENRQVLEMLFVYLPDDDDPWTFGALTSLVSRLGATMEEKRRLREELLGLLNRATDSFLAEKLIKSIMELNPVSEDKRQIRQILLNIVASQVRGHRLDVMNELFQRFVDLGPSAEDRDQMRDLLLSWLEKQCQAGESWGMDKDAVALLVQLSSTGQEKMEVREKLVELLTIGSAPTTDSLEKLKAQSMGLHLEEGVVQLDPTVDDLQTWRAWAVVPTTRLLAATRRNSTLAAWLAGLPYLPLDPVD